MNNFRFSLVVSTLFAFIALPIVASAENPQLEVTSPNPVKYNLEQMIGKSVTLKLSSGEELGGKVGKVGAEAVQITEISGKEFYDALIPLNNIVAVIVRARNS